MFVHGCHCDDCQRLTGSAFVLNAIIETQAIKLLRGEPVAVPLTGENGPHDIYRCPRCQTALWSDYGRKANIRSVRIGTLDLGPPFPLAFFHPPPLVTRHSSLERSAKFRPPWNEQFELIPPCDSGSVLTLGSRKE